VLGQPLGLHCWEALLRPHAGWRLQPLEALGLDPSRTLLVDARPSHAAAGEEGSQLLLPAWWDDTGDDARTHTPCCLLAMERRPAC
jgi:hypothetical protein